MERVREYGGFAIWFLGLGYAAAWALAPGRLSVLPTSLHAIGLTAGAFLPLQLWGFWRARRNRVIALPPKPVVAIYHRPPPPVSRPPVKPRGQFGLRGVPRPEQASH